LLSTYKQEITIKVKHGDAYCNFRAQEEEEDQQIQGLPRLHGEFEADLDYMVIPCSKKPNKTKERKEGRKRGRERGREKGKDSGK
jgi:hypothetical protein